ncbi:YfiR family protein [Massilia suwonensis]|uniref:YfiR family protein n=1 Tax=Massilia suwonensis TaxID=648895 RepID=A0ABW0MQ15_9BURK
MAFAVRVARSAPLVLFALWLLAGTVHAQPVRPEAAKEVAVKAAYLYKFAGFVDWPPSAFARPDSPLVIGVAGNDELAGQLEQLVVNRSVGGHPLAVRRLRRGDAPTGLHVLYVGGAGADPGAWSELLAGARGLPLLTVGEAADLPNNMIRFVMVDQHLRFEVALGPVAPSGLKISARLLAAALRVTGAS